MQQSNRCKAVIFDVDGVLVNTVPLHYGAWKKTFALFSIRITKQDYQQFINGVPRIQGIRNMLNQRKIRDEELVEIIADAKQKLFRLLVKQTPPRPLAGVISFLEYASSHHIPTVAASSSKNAKTILSVANLTHYFKAVVDGNDFTKSKPDPDIFLTAAKRIGISATKTMVVEDAYVGACAAKKAGAFVVGVLTTKDTKLYSICDIVLPTLSSYKRLFA